MTQPTASHANADINDLKLFGDLLPKFSGNSHELQSFIVEIENYIEKFGSTGNSRINQYCFAMIKSRIIDEARIIINSGPIPNSWVELKQALINKFGFRINFDVLQDQYQNLRRTHKESLLDFLERIKHTKLQFDYQLQMQGFNMNELVIYRNISEKIGHRVIYNNVDENVRNLLDSNVKNFDDTCKMLENREIKRQQLNFIPNFKSFSHSPPMKNERINFPNHNILQQTNYNQNRNFSMQPNRNLAQSKFFTNNEGYSNFPSQPLQMQSRRDITQPKFFTNDQVFGKPPDVFKPNPNYRPNNRPEPMSVRTRILPTKRPNESTSIRQKKPNYQPRENHFRPNAPPNFISEELYNTEQQNESFENEQYDVDFDQNHDTDYQNSEQAQSYNVDQNFQETAYQSHMT